MPASHRFLTADEIDVILATLHDKVYGRKRQKAIERCQPGWFRTLAVFRLSCCCGLRSCEIRGVRVVDLVTEGARPCLRVPASATKGRAEKRKSRFVPLWWDEGTRRDLEQWLTYSGMKRRAIGLPDDQGLLIPQLFGAKRWTGGLSRANLAGVWRRAIGCLGVQRARQLSIHCGRHSFISHALAAGHCLAAVRDAVGHASIATTNLYTHAIDDGGLPDVFLARRVS